MMHELRLMTSFKLYSLGQWNNLVFETQISFGNGNSGWSVTLGREKNK